MSDENKATAIAAITAPAANVGRELMFGRYDREQIELLKRHRAGEHDPRVREGLHLSINAIATALRNSG